MTGPDDVPVRLAATVLLVRPAQAPDAPGLEVLTLTRSAKLAFSAGVTAFPGGKVEPSDRSAEEAAVRETFEETGILVVRGEEGAGSGAGAVLDRSWVTPQLSAAVEADATLFLPLLAEHGLAPDTDAMHLVDQWVTPSGNSRRYDTLFYMAAVPAGQEPLALSGESASWQWLTPAQALAEFRAGVRELMPPTWTQLRRLAEVQTVEQALALPPREEPVQPRMTSAEPRRVVDFPEHEAYAEDLDAFHRAAPGT